MKNGAIARNGPPTRSWPPAPANGGSISFLPRASSSSAADGRTARSHIAFSSERCVNRRVVPTALPNRLLTTQSTAFAPPYPFCPAPADLAPLPYAHPCHESPPPLRFIRRNGPFALGSWEGHASSWPGLCAIARCQLRSDLHAHTCVPRTLFVRPRQIPATRDRGPPRDSSRPRETKLSSASEMVCGTNF